MTLQERAMLVVLGISVWEIERTDTKRAKEIAAKYGADPKMVSAGKYLIDPDALKPIKAKRTEMRTYHLEHTVPWLDNGTRMISNAGYVEYKQKIQQLQSEMETLVEDLIDEYPRLYDSAKSLLNGLHDSSEYPAIPDYYGRFNRDALRRKFGVSIRVFPVPSDDDFRTKLDADDVNAIKAQIRADLESASMQATQHVADRMRKAIQGMASTLRAYSPGKPGTRATGTFHDTLVSNVRDLIDIIPAINVAGDYRIDQIAQQMRDELTSIPADTLRDNQWKREDVAAAADSIAARMAEFGL